MKSALSEIEPRGLSPLAAELHLFLYDRPLHPELFRHYANFRVRQTRYHVDIWIVGLSHVITVTTGDKSVTEVVMCESDVLPSRGQVSHFRMKGERDLDTETNDGWQYMISTQIETMEEPLFRSVHADLLKHARHASCFHEYEPWAEGEMVPFTYIDHEAWDGEFHVHAFHTFPGERSLVKTQSIFELPK